MLEIIEKTIGANGYECLDIEFNSSQRMLRIFIDHQEGIDLTDCAEIAKLIQQVEELDKCIPGNYSLEVSSPGFNRPLRLKQHFKKSVGERLKVYIENEHRSRVGKLITIDDDDLVTLETKTGLWSFPLSHLTKAQVIYHWH